MEPYPTQQPACALQQPHAVLRPPLPAWARVFRLVLICLGGGIALSLVVFLSVSMTSQASIYTESGRADIQLAIWLGLLLIVLSIPYVLVSLVYAVLWAVKLRGRGYRRYPGTTWFLVLGPIAIVVPVLAWLSL
ncbi:hypothetical protein ACX80V_05455 [Arthrobacter sp. MDT3-24]